MATILRPSKPPIAARTPRPELRRHLSSATRALPSPHLHRSPELRRHQSFTTRDSLFSNLHLRHIFVVTNASRPYLLFCAEIRRHLSSPELCYQSSTFVRAAPFTCLHLPRLLHSMSFPFTPLQTTKGTVFWRLPPAPASSPPSPPTNWEVVYQLLQPPRR